MHYVREEVLTDATATKNTIAAELKTILRGITERARIAFGIGSSKYSLFHTKDLSKLPDSELLLFSRVVKRSADTYHTELLPVGLTAAMITALDAKNTDFEIAVNSQRTAIAMRDAATNNRSEKALELYNLMTSYCETGKVIWYETNEACYNDYVIFGANGQPVTLIAPTEFICDNTAHKFTWTAIDNATSYEIQTLNGHTDWTQLWTGSDTQYIYTPSPGTTAQYRIRARNSSGYGPICDAINI